MIRPDLKHVGLLITKWIIFFLVLVGIFRIVGKEGIRLTEFEYSFSSPWAIASGLIYICSLGLFAWCWRINTPGKSIPIGLALRAYYLGNIFKYVPGKLLTIAVRVIAAREKGVPVGHLVSSSVLETVLVMGVGIVIGFFSLAGTDYLGFGPQLAVVGIGIVIAGLLLTPKFLPILERLALKRFAKDSTYEPARFVLHRIATGALLVMAGWCVMGLALTALVVAMGNSIVWYFDPVLLIGVVAASTVAGFISLLPGGIGMRELVIVQMLGEKLGYTQAVVLAIMARLIWLAAEGLSAGVAWLSGKTMTSLSADNLKKQVNT